MRLTLTVLRAKQGDCFMLHWGTDADPRLMLIDGGPDGVYADQLLPSLQRIHATRGIGHGLPLPVDVIMVSHVDDDHISGIIELAKRQVRRTAPIGLEVDSVWHNSFDDLLGKRPGRRLSAGQRLPAGTASVLADLSTQLLDGTAEVGHDAASDMAEVLAGINQGRTLRDDAEKLGWELNSVAGGQLILADAGTGAVDVAGLDVIVVGPLAPELRKLQIAHDKWVREHLPDKSGNVATAAAVYADVSVSNLSSIVIHVAVGGKTVLLTGDARGDKILLGLETTGLMPKGGTIELDILKVPHHGSDRNVTPEFFRRVRARHYVFSGDGQYGNPERKTMEMLLAARHGDSYTIHLTYPVEDVDVGRKLDWETQRASEMKRGKCSRPAWSHPDQDLAPLLTILPLEVSLAIVPDGPSYRIDLLEPLVG